MASHSATITVTRENEDGAEDIEVEVEGDFEDYGSYNPNERGYHLSDWEVVSPKGFKLTKGEEETAEEALYAAARN